MKELYWTMFEKNIGVITKEEQEKLAHSKVAIIGLGGIGGIALEFLVRSGVQNFVLCDKDKFEFSNFNRQIFAIHPFLGKMKVKVAQQRIKNINPNVKIDAYSEFNEKNAVKVLTGVNVVVDGLDNALGRVVVARTAKKLKIPYIFGAADRASGMSTIFMPDDDFEKILRLPSYGKPLDIKTKQKLAACQRCDYVLGVVPNLIGVFEALQCIKLLLGRKVIRAPNFLIVDAMKFNPFSIRRLG